MEGSVSVQLRKPALNSKRKLEKQKFHAFGMSVDTCVISPGALHFCVLALQRPSTVIAALGFQGSLGDPLRVLGIGALFSAEQQPFTQVWLTARQDTVPSLSLITAL